MRSQKRKETNDSINNKSFLDILNYFLITEIVIENDISLANAANRS